ncbi:MAG: hypothetical protein N2D54_05855 [Chloroflexota bacterium]
MPQEKIPPSIWILPLSFVLPITQLVIFFARFKKLPPGGLAEAFVFFPGGLLGAWGVITLMQRSVSMKAKNKVVEGFLYAVPFALLGGLMAGMILTPLVSATLAQAIPLILGAYLGYRVGLNSRN